MDGLRTCVVLLCFAFSHPLPLYFERHPSGTTATTTAFFFTCKARAGFKAAAAGGIAHDPTRGEGKKEEAQDGAAHAVKMMMTQMMMRTMSTIMHLIGRALFWYFSASFSSTMPFLVFSTACSML